MNKEKSMWEASSKQISNYNVDSNAIVNNDKCGQPRGKIYITYIEIIDSLLNIMQMIHLYGRG